jgi:hypoxia up-regulated 1
LQDKLSTSSDWLYEESDNAKTADFQAKLKDLKSIVDPALKRMKESTDRPARIKLLQDMIKNAESMKQLIEGQIKSDEDTYSSALSASSTSTEQTETSSSTPAPAASGDDSLDDLDDDSYSSSSSKTSTKTAVAAKPTGPKYALFTPTDLSSLTEIYDSSKLWVDEKLALQEKLTESDDPALTVVDIDSRLREFERVLNRMYERMTAASKKTSSKKTKSKEKKPEAEKAKGKEKEKAKSTDDTRKDEL